MSESAFNDHTFEPNNGFDLVPEHARIDENSTDTSIDQHLSLTEQSEQLLDLKLRSILDTGMSQSEIDSIVKSWEPSRVFYGKQNSERPRQAIQWMLEKSHITIDATEEKTQSAALKDRQRRETRGLPLTKAQNQLKDLTAEQLLKLSVANESDTRIALAQRRIEVETSKGLGSLLELLDEIEGYVMEKCANANLVRLFNGVDDKRGGKDRDLIVAKRTLVIMLGNELIK